MFVGDRYFEGRGVCQNYLKAMKKYKKAKTKVISPQLPNWQLATKMTFEFKRNSKRQLCSMAKRLKVVI
jgi:TPR repeat protein